ncbi:MAG: DUF3168 domain-containing protein [Devosiaceae bacterium]|nr:DUF3168 domain-containing protein [Devosiaceae bacterium]
MSHPIADLQTSILTLLNADGSLISLIGGDGVFDMAPKGKSGTYIAILRHDLLARDADVAPGYDHRIQFRVWNPSPNRSGVLAPAQRVVAVLTDQDLSTPTLIVTNVAHLRTDSAIDVKSGRANATINFRIFSEPAS